MKGISGRHHKREEWTNDLSFQSFSLRRRHLFRAKLEDLLRQELEDDHVVLADGEIRLRRCDDFGDEGRPVVGPAAVSVVETMRRERETYHSCLRI